MEVFKNIMANFETLSGRFVRDVVMKASNGDIMNAMQRCILTLYTYDSKPEDNSAENVLRQSIEMIAKLPLIAVYSYHSYRHFRKDETLFIRNPQKDLSLAENILLMLRPDGKYTELEAKVLDIALILHAEHGGGNNIHHTRSYLIRNRHLFFRCSIHRFPQGTSSWWCKPQSPEHVRGYQGKRQRLDR